MVSPWIKPEETAFENSPYVDMAIDYATFVLYKLTGEKYPGLARATETYVHERYVSPRQRVESFSTLNAIGIPRGVQYPDRLYLKGSPVHRVYSVKIGDTVLDPSSYELYNHRFLMFRNKSIWSTVCGDQGVTVQYSYGMMPPKAGIMAAKVLTSELILLMEADGDASQCRIPDRVKSITREGLTFDMIDPMEFLDDGRTGIWELDLFIRTANPAKAKKQPKIVSSSDASRYRRR